VRHAWTDAAEKATANTRTVNPSRKTVGNFYHVTVRTRVQISVTPAVFDDLHQLRTRTTAHATLFDFMNVP